VPVDAQGSPPKTVKDIPGLDQELECSVPLIHRSLEHPDYPGLWGSAFAVSFNNKVGFITAGHVMSGHAAQGAGEGSGVSVVTGFSPQIQAEIDSFYSRIPSDPLYNDATDIAVLHPASSPTFVHGETRAFVLDEIAAPSAFKQDSLFAVRGYPRDDRRTGINYERNRIRFLAHSTFGTYVGPSPIAPGVHIINLDTREVGGLQGFSGSPVFRAVRYGATWKTGLAGMVIKGNEARLHFVDSEYILKFISSDIWWCPHHAPENLPPEVD